MTLPRSRATGPEALVAAPDNSTGVFGSLRYSRHAGTEMLLIGRRHDLSPMTLLGQLIREGWGASNAHVQN